MIDAIPGARRPFTAPRRSAAPALRVSYYRPRVRRRGVRRGACRSGPDTWTDDSVPSDAGRSRTAPHLSRRLERDLLTAGECVVRVPPKLMAHARDSARSYGKSDPIDALAVARAALREPELPTARFDGPAREVRLLASHRDDLVAERTRIINRLRWHLDELDPSWQPAARTLWRPKNLNAITEHLYDLDGLVARLARVLVKRCRDLTAQILDTTPLPDG
jgi:transposase